MAFYESYGLCTLYHAVITQSTYKTDTSKIWNFRNIIFILQQTVMKTQLQSIVPTPAAQPSLPSPLRLSVHCAGGGQQGSADCQPAHSQGGLPPRTDAVAPDGGGGGASHAEHGRHGDGPGHGQHSAQPLPPEGGTAFHLQVRRHPRPGPHAQVA